jgi:WD40 repeat protein
MRHVKLAGLVVVLGLRTLLLLAILACAGCGYQVMSVAYSPNGKSLASGGGDKTVRVWDVASGREVQRAVREGAVWSVAYSPDGKSLAFGNAVAYSPDGRSLASSASPVVVWDMASGREVWRLQASDASDGTVLLWDVASGREVQRFVGHAPPRLKPLSENPYPIPVWSLTFSPDGKSLVSCGSDGYAWLWDVASGRKMRGMRWLMNVSVANGELIEIGAAEYYADDRKRDSVASVAYSPDGKSLAVCFSNHHNVRILDAVSWQLAERELPADCNSVAYSPDGRSLVLGGRDLQVWDLTSGRTMWEKNRVSEGGMGYVNSVAFSPGGKTVVSGASNGTVQVWDVVSGREVLKIDANR